MAECVTFSTKTNGKTFNKTFNNTENTDNINNKR
jgi:hypothetical protein